MSDLVAFLLARIEEVEAVAREDADDEGFPAISSIQGLTGWADGRTVDTIAFPPAHVLAECEAKRRIVELTRDIDPYSETDWADVGELDDSQVRVLADVLRLLALADADHPDYDEAWRA